MKVAVKAIGTLKLDLGLGKFLVLDSVYFIPSLKRNLLSVSLLVRLGCRLVIDFSGIKVFQGHDYLGCGTFMHDYLKLNCSIAKQEIMLIENRENSLSTDTVIGVKRSLFNNKSAYLWHRRLGHISKERLKTLIKNKILPELDFDDLIDCIECYKGKLTNSRKKTAVRSQKLLELIHTDICGPFKHKTICGNSYFITFTDDCSRYCYIYLLSEKSQALQAFKIFRTEVELQQETKIKIVRSDRGGEFYGKYTEAGQQKGPFALYLQEQGIKAQYTTPYNPQQNGVAERKNRTFLNMVRSMMCTSGLPKFLWGEALRTANYICNRAPSKAVEKTPFEIWCGRQPSLHHCHVWGCKAEAKTPNALTQKLESKTVSCNFIGYCEKSKGFKFYAAHHTLRIFETYQAKFLDEVVCNSSFEDLSADFDEISVDKNLEIFLPLLQNQYVAAQTTENTDLDQNLVDPISEVPQNESLAEPVAEMPHDMVLDQNPALEQPEFNDPQPRRSQRQRKPTFGENSDYVVYLQETDEILAEDHDPTTFKQAAESIESQQWQLAMEAEMDSMSQNSVWELVKPDPNHNAIGCKWVFKTKRDEKGNVERHKARLVAKGFTQKQGIDYTETFSPVSTKDSFRIIMALVAHYNMELHQMDVKTVFLNGELDEVIYMKQPVGFVKPGKEDHVCRLRKSIYGLKQASRQWYKKFDSVISSFGFTENIVDECVYLKTVGNNFIFLILYVDDILLASTHIKLLKDTKAFLSNNFDMKDLGEASFVLGIEIKRDRKQGLLGLSQHAYICKVLKRFGMESCATGEVPMSKGDKFTKNSKNGGKSGDMESRPYARLIGSLMYAQVCTRPDLSFAVGIL
ncbi:putative RNA-directed DNA polymerase [Rosa chinensis]|uniref:Putative RNA-directed DNA polymerase n=1 Tax=Rosa chinensis TaxID=74649 RepID=A0A2P6SK01_ROSCH|nr:putative RNA-directed DNA polymerase [Rosa chinensis]